VVIQFKQAPFALFRETPVERLTPNDMTIQIQPEEGVTLRFSADSWAEVYDADGQRLFYDIGSAKSSRNLSGTPPLRVVLGNASGVSLSINGRRSPVPANAVQNDGAQFTINRSGRIVRAQSDGAAAAESKPGD